ncbi:MAG: hypothetical protein OXF01_08900 [Gemmatimonadetes bacterium]|nr:hypothetical protein [Gemmatimonadota bacterium]
MSPVAERIETLGGVAALVDAARPEIELFQTGHDRELDRVVEVAAHLVCRWCPDAPDVVLKEAILRCAGYLAEAPRENLAAEAAGQRRAEYAPGQLAALRHSGAMAVLAPWKVRRAGVIG